MTPGDTRTSRSRTKKRTPEVARRTRYTDAEIERGLVALALSSGNSRRASAMLAGQGTKIPHRTLYDWQTSTRDTARAMSEENVEVVREALNTWVEVDEGLANPQELADYYAPDGVWDLGTYSGWLGQSQFRGMEGFLEFRSAWIEPYDDYRYEVERILDGGANRVVAIFRQRGRLRESAAWVESHYAVIYTVEERVIQGAHVYASPEEALEAAGLSE